MRPGTIIAARARTQSCTLLLNIGNRESRMKTTITQTSQNFDFTFLALPPLYQAILERASVYVITRIKASLNGPKVRTPHSPPSTRPEVQLPSLSTTQTRNRYEAVRRSLPGRGCFFCSAFRIGFITITLPLVLHPTLRRSLR